MEEEYSELNEISEWKSTVNTASTVGKRSTVNTASTVIQRAQFRFSRSEGYKYQNVGVEKE